MSTLYRTIKNIKDKSTIIKIGAVDGSGFFYLGTVGDYLENKEKYEEMDRAHFENRLKRANENFEYLLNLDTSFSGYAKRQYRNFKNSGQLPNFSMIGYNQFLELHSQQLITKYNTLNQEKAISANNSPLNSREVKEVFEAERVAEPNGATVIIIKGSEMGVYWTTDETELPTMELRGE